MSEIYQHREGSVLAVRTVQHGDTVMPVAIHITGREPALLLDLLSFDRMSDDEIRERFDNGPYFKLSSGEYVPFLKNTEDREDLTSVASIYRETIYLHVDRMSRDLQQTLGLALPDNPA